MAKRRKKSAIAKKANRTRKQIQRKAGKSANKAAVHIVRKTNGASSAQTLKNFKRNGWTGKQIEAATGVKPAQQRRILEGKAGPKWDASLREARRMSRRPAPTGNQTPPAMTRAGQHIKDSDKIRAEQRRWRAEDRALAGKTTSKRSKTTGTQAKQRAPKPTKPTKQERRAAEIERRAAAQRGSLITGLAKQARAGAAADDLIAQIPDASAAERSRIRREAKTHARERAQQARDAERIQAKQARDAARQAERDAKQQAQAERKAEKDAEREAKKQAAEQAKQDRAREREARRELLNEAIREIRDGHTKAEHITEIGGQPLTAAEQKRIDAAARAAETAEAKARAREEIKTDITAEDPDEKQESQIEGGDDDDWGTAPMDNGLDDSDIDGGSDSGKVSNSDHTPPALLKIKTVTIG